MCNCKGIVIGSYDNQLLLGYYRCMIQYRDNRMKAGLSGEGIPVDRCLVDEVIALWEQGFKTFGCCCGHNKFAGFINVDKDDFETLISMGYEKYIYPLEPDRNDTIIPKSIAKFDVIAEGGYYVRVNQ